MLLYGMAVVAPGEIGGYKILLIRKCSLTLTATSCGVSAYKKEDECRSIKLFLEDLNNFPLSKLLPNECNRMRIDANKSLLWLQENNTCQSRQPGKMVSKRTEN